MKLAPDPAEGKDAVSVAVGATMTFVTGKGRRLQ